MSLPNEEGLDRSFQLWHFDVSHGMLLLRSPRTGESPTNVDLVFAGVSFMSLPRHLGRIQVTETAIPLPVSMGVDMAPGERLFEIASGSAKHWIVAVDWSIAENALGLFELPESMAR